jgi:hypothetical protein
LHIIRRSLVDHPAITGCSRLVHHPLDHFRSAQGAPEPHRSALPAHMTSLTASDQLKDLMPDIDHAMQSGMPRSKVLQILPASDLEMTMNYFKCARTRVEKGTTSVNANTTSTEKDGIMDINNVSSTSLRQNPLLELNNSAAFGTVISKFSTALFKHIWNINFWDIMFKSKLSKLGSNKK